MNDLFTDLRSNGIGEENAFNSAIAILGTSR